MADETIDTESLRRTRVRAILERRFFAILLGLFVLCILAGGVAYQVHLDPAVETEEQIVSSWQEQSTLSHQAQVLRPNLVFEQDQTLPNQQVYFAHLSPELEGVHEYTYSASGDGELDVTSSASLQLLSVGRDGETYWERSEQLVERQAQLSPGERTTAAVEINVTEAAQEIDRIQSSLDSSIGTAEIGVVFDTRVTGTVNGESVANLHRDSFVVEPTGTTFSVEASEGVQETHERTQIVESEVTYSPLALYAPFGIIGGSFVVIVGLTSLRYWGRLGPSPAAMAALERHQQHSEFADWISTGQIPETALDGSRIELTSLEDIVDVAIDTNQRVLEDPTQDVFYVLAGDWYYSYRPVDPQEPGPDALDITPVSSRPSENGEKDESERTDSSPEPAQIDHALDGPTTDSSGTPTDGQQKEPSDHESEVSHKNNS